MPSFESLFHPAVFRWFSKTFHQPTPPQEMAWPVIARGEDVLLLAPTGWGKTLAAFLYALDWLIRQGVEGEPPPGVAILYLSPLKALNNDIHHNLEAPLQGIREAADELNLSLPPLTRGLRTGDTSPSKRQSMLRHPPQILMTTPESLFLMLSSKAHEMLKQVKFVIVDEIHTLFPNKRGAHLALSLARLAYLVSSPIQRIGLSATLAPLDQVAAFLRGTGPGVSPVQILDAGNRKELDLKIRLSVEDLASLPEKTIWPSIYRLLLQLIQEVRTTLVFVNSRRLAERITVNLNHLAKKTVARTHHGSISREVRLEVEGLLRKGQLPCIVATSSLELGIDIGFIEQVIQVESPGEVARGLQRVGRAGHTLHQKSTGYLIPKSRTDLLESAVIFREMKKGRIEEVSSPQNPLDVLAQHLVAMTATRCWQLEEIYRLITWAYPFATLSRNDLEGVLAMLSGQYETRGYLDLKPRLFWDRKNNQVRSDPYGKRLAYTGGGTIPDRGYYRVQLGTGGPSLGELDEEFVYERRIGDTFLLGTSSWQIAEIKEDVVIVRPSQSGEGLVPFWRAEQKSRSFLLGRRVGEFLEECEGFFQGEKRGCPILWLKEECSLEEKGALALYRFLEDGRKALGALPTHRHLVVEEFFQGEGERRILLHSPYGSRFHLLLSLLFREEFKRELGFSVEALPSDDGLLFRFPAEAPFPGFPWGVVLDHLEEKVAQQVSSTALFGMTFRHCAQRSLVLPKGDFSRRQALWLSRLKAKNLLDGVKKIPDFPLIKETYREILSDFFPLEEAQRVFQDIQAGEIICSHVERKVPSPFAVSHLFNFTAGFLYGDDTPLASESSDFGFTSKALKDLGGRSLPVPLNEKVIESVVQRIQGLSFKRVTPEKVLHFLYRRGDVLLPELSTLFPGREEELENILSLLQEEGEVVSLLQGTKNFLMVPSRLPLYLGALPGSQVRGEHPLPLPYREAFSQLIAQYARTHGPFTTQELVKRYNLPSHQVKKELSLLKEEGILEQGSFLPGEEEVWCNRDLFQEIWQRSRGVRRRSIQPQTQKEYSKFLATWHGVGGGEDLATVLHRLQGLFLPAHLWEGVILPSRILTYSPHDLDSLLLSGQFSWQIQGTESSFGLVFTPVFPLLPGLFQDFLGKYIRSLPSVKKHLSWEARRVQDCLTEKGALTFPQLLMELSFPTPTLWQSLQELLFSGYITNDTLGPVRYLLQTSPKSRRGSKGVLSSSVMATMGRWSLVTPSQTEDVILQVWALLSRYGILSPVTVKKAGESWGEISPILYQLEMVDILRQGYLVEGLGGMQFARPEVLSLLQQKRPQSSFCQVFSQEDPANPLPLFAKQKGAWDWQVLKGGEPLLWARGRELSIGTCEQIAPQLLQSAIQALIETLRPLYAGEKILVKEFQGVQAILTPLGKILTDLGFEKVYQKFILWPSVPLGKKG